jgi:DMSO/TMAO reductase YedYZ molybdopterin-dependent catalytic subunit
VAVREKVRAFLRRPIFRRIPWYRIGAGSIAGGAWLLITLLLRSFGLGVFLPEVAVDFVVDRIPGQVESFFIQTMGGGAKVLALLAAVAVFLILPGIYASLYRRVQRWLKRRWLVIAFYTLSPAAIVLLAILPLLDSRFLGSSPIAIGFAALGQLLGFWLYAAVLDYFLVDVAARHPQGFSLSRRQFLIGGVAAIAFAVLAVYGIANLAVKKGRLAFASVQEMVRKEITPVSEFYIVTKNVIDPSVDAGSWRLQVGGKVANPATHSYADLLARSDPSSPDAAEEFATLECVSNEVGGNLISTARWTGVRLSAILDAAILDPDADWIVFRCADGYTAGIPRDRALDPDTMIALFMTDNPLVNPRDFPLAPAHGFPARIIVPGLYGMFHAKWLVEIEATAGEYKGYWQQKGWTNQGQIRTTTIIATPPDGTVLRGTGPVTIGGIAFAGDRGISSVEVGVSSGGLITWAEATRKPPTSGLTWVLWTFDWTPPRSGSFRIFARSIDGTGMPQEANLASPFPDGSAGYDSITLLVG